MGMDSTHGGAGARSIVDVLIVISDHEVVVHVFKVLIGQATVVLPPSLLAAVAAVAAVALVLLVLLLWHHLLLGLLELLEVLVAGIAGMGILGIRTLE